MENTHRFKCDDGTWVQGVVIEVDNAKVFFATDDNGNLDERYWGVEVLDTDEIEEV